jgi:hypothetical protein
MFVVRVNGPKERPHFRAFESEPSARQSLNAGCWKVFRGEAMAAFLFDVPGETKAGPAIDLVRAGGGVLAARDLQDGEPPNASGALRGALVAKRRRLEDYLNHWSNMTPAEIDVLNSEIVRDVQFLQDIGEMDA